MSHDGILLLGGTGFIGSALAARLRTTGREVFCHGRRDGGGLEALLPRCGTVVHLASTTTPGSSADRPAAELDNLAPTLRLLEAMRQCPATHLIFLSSGGTVYGDPAQVPVAEDSPAAPLSWHGAGKAAQEIFLRTFRKAHPVTILRPANAYGPGQALRHGFGLIRTVLEHARHGSEMEIWGDGESVRDFVYIDDVVDACMRCIDRPADSGTYNIGSGRGHSLRQVLALAEALSGRPLRVVSKAPRGTDVRSIVLDASLARSALAWEATVGLEEGMRRTWAWLRDT